MMNTPVYYGPEEVRALLRLKTIRRARTFLRQLGMPSFTVAGEVRIEAGELLAGIAARSRRIPAPPFGPPAEAIRRHAIDLLRDLARISPETLLQIARDLVAIAQSQSKHPYIERLRKEFETEPQSQPTATHNHPNP